MKKLGTTIELIKILVGTGSLYFAEEISVDLGENAFVNLWAVCVKDNRVALMDVHGQWHEFEEGDRNFQQIVDKLEQKVGKMANQHNKSMAS